MSDDHLSNEISISAELTEHGVKAGAKSRTLAAVDRLLGGVVDLANVPIERIAQKGRAKTDTQVAAIRALGEKQLAAIHSDPDYAARAMEQHLKVIGTRHENKTEAVRAALEDLRENPPSEEQNNSGGERLDDAFVNRWERYAEDATSDQLREKWGRVLASEVRAPGTFSAKVMRIVDELDGTTANVFEQLCANRIGNAVPKIIAGKLSFADATRLVDADLILDPDGGHVRLSGTASLAGGDQIWLIQFHDFGVSVPLNIGTNLPFTDQIMAMTSHEGKPVVPIYLLTQAGDAIASILPNTAERAIRSLALAASRQIPEARVVEFRRTTGTQWAPVASFLAGQMVA